MFSSRRTATYLAPPRLVLLVLLLPLSQTSPVPAATDSVDARDAGCSVHSTQAGLVADCSSRNLHDVPQDLRPTLVSLDLRNNSLARLSKDSFSRYPNLSHLDLSWNRALSFIDPKTFEPLEQLKELSYFHTRSLSFTRMFESLRGLKGRNMSSIDFSWAHVTDNGVDSLDSLIVNASMVGVLADVCVADFSFKENHVVSMDLTPLFKGIFRECIKSLDLSSNHFETGLQIFYELYKFANLEYFNVALRFPRGPRSRADVAEPNPMDPKVVHLSDSAETKYAYFPKSLSNVNLNGVTAGLRLVNMHFHASGLRKFTFSRNNIKNFVHPMTGLEHLEEFDLSYCDLSIVAPEFFDTFPGLTLLNVSGAFLNRRFLLDWGRRLLQPLTRLIDMDLSNNDVSQLAQDTFPASVRRLHLSNNAFSAVPVDVGRLPHLEELDLSFNAISVLDQAQMAALDGVASQGRNLTLRLYGNPLACDCSALAFLTWLQTTAVHVDRAKDLPCLTEAKTYSTIGQVLEQTQGQVWRKCSAPFWLAFSGVGLPVLLLVMVVVWLGAKFRSQIQHVVLRLVGVGGAGRRRGDFPYDAYVAHSDKDEDVALAYGPLRRLLEERGGVRLFLREREMLPAVLPGASRAEGIVEGVHCCWRTLVLVTPHFLQDEWCDFTAQVAYRTLDWRTPGRVLLLLAGPLSKADIPQTLLSAVEEEDVFVIWDRQEDDPVWDRLTDRILGRQHDNGQNLLAQLTNEKRAYKKMPGKYQATSVL